MIDYYRDNQLHSMEEGIIWITFIEVGRPAHDGWHHSLGWDPELCKPINGAEQQQLCLLTVDGM